MLVNSASFVVQLKTFLKMFFDATKVMSIQIN